MMFKIKDLSKIELELKPGVYFLFENDELVYIGQSVDVQSRCLFHVKKWPNIEKGFYYRVEDREKRNRTELNLIYKHQPKYNINNSGGITEYNYKSVKKMRTKLLTDKEKTVLFNRHGLFGNDKKTLQKIGDSLELTRERIRQIQLIAEFKIMPAY